MFRDLERIAQRHSIRRQLLLSHLSVALVGLGMLCIALFATYDLRSRVLLLADQGNPLTLASLQKLVGGVQQTQAGLRGWIISGRLQFLDDWQIAWRDEIQPSVAQLTANCQRVREDRCTPTALQELQTLLTDLQESQWWVQDLLRTPGNSSARVAYSPERESTAAASQSLLATLSQAGEERTDPDWRILLARFEDILQANDATRTALRAFLDTKIVGAMAIRTPPTSLLQQPQSTHWNIALNVMALETDPLASQVIGQAARIAADFRASLGQEAKAAQAASAMTVWNLVLMILTMGVIAYALSKRHAEKLALPITTLAAATRQMAMGHLNRDLPAHGNDEFSDLTRAFNTMRISLQQAQAELQDANATLERRVIERTRELASANEALNLEIANRVQTETALRDSEARLRAITRAIPDLVFVLDEDGRYCEILAEQKDQIAIGSTPLRGRLLSEVHDPNSAAFLLDIIQRALSTQRTQIAEYELQTPSKLRWFESRTAPLEVRFDDKPAAIVVARDITQRKQAEAQFRQAQKMQAIGQLTGGIAHDFNNLLAIIMGNLELLHEQLAEQPRLRNLANQAQQALKAVDRGANLTRRLLAFARRQPLLAQPTNLNKMVLGMLDLMRRTLGATIEIETVLAPGLEQTLVDVGQLENALLNLVINARDAMPQGGKLTLETANVLLDEDYVAPQKDLRSGPYVMLAVRDTGTGIDPALLERVFEPFFTTKESGKGSGLGLSMVYGLVKQSGGHITIYSEPGQGTTLRLYLPRFIAAEQATTEQLPHLPVEPPSCQGRGEIILVVEDNADVRLFAVRALQNLGYATRQAGDAATAIKILDATPEIALLFTDIVLPGDMDGVKLAIEIRKRAPGLPVLFTSGYTEHALVDNGQPFEGPEVLIKPYRKSDLGQKLRALLD